LIEISGVYAMVLRSEHAGDAGAIFRLTERAFAGMAHSAGTEAFIVDALRDANALAVSLVAEAEGVLVGHVAFSRVRISDGSGDWYGMGPVSVAPERQRQGIGTALIREGLKQLKERGAKGCVVLGDPGYYARFGFEETVGLRYEDAPPEYFRALPFGDSGAVGTVQFHPAFSVRPQRG
jgi:putative acetyltransferase